MPVAAADSKAARRQQAADDRAKAREARAAGAEAEAAVVLDADGNPVEKPRYGAGAVIIAFLAGQLLSTIAYVVVQSSTNYDFAVPTGVGAAVGQASAAGRHRPGPRHRRARRRCGSRRCMQLPLWLGLGLIPVWFAVNEGKGVVADLGLRMKAIDVPIGLAVGVASQLVMVPVLYWLAVQGHRRQGRLGRRPLAHRSGHRPALGRRWCSWWSPSGRRSPRRSTSVGFAQRIFGRRHRPACGDPGLGARSSPPSHLAAAPVPGPAASFGLILGFLAWRTGRLGPAIWAHVGFNTVTAATLVFHLG